MAAASCSADGVHVKSLEARWLVCGCMRARIFAEENRKWLTLASVSFGLFMIMLDNTVVNVALPSIQRDLGSDLSELEWIVTGYALTFASLMLVGGKVADAYGRRRIFVVGIVVFTLASLLCGIADSSEMLIGARVLQGAGAALMNPATLSIIAATFPPRERGTAIGIWAGTSALALAIGPLVGGLITEHLEWSWIFFVNVPIGALGIVASYLFIDESRDETHASLDLPGLSTSAIGLFALTYGLIEANTYGWTSTRIVGTFVLAVVALASFVVIERRRREPMLPLDLFRSGTYTGANLVVLLVALAMFGVFFFVSLYMQNILGYSPVQTGAAFLPMTILIILVAPIAGRASDRIGSRGLMTAGMILIAVQLVMFSRLEPGRVVLGSLPGAPDRRSRDVPDDDAERCRGDSQRSVGEVGRGLGGAEQRPAGRRNDGRRDHGGDRGRGGGWRANAGGIHAGLRDSAARGSGNRCRRRRRRLCPRPPTRGRGRSRAVTRLPSLPPRALSQARRSRGRRAIHSPVGQVRSGSSSAEEGGWRGKRRFPPPTENAPGCGSGGVSRSRRPLPGGDEPAKSWLCGPATSVLRPPLTRRWCPRIRSGVRSSAVWA